MQFTIFAVDALPPFQYYYLYITAESELNEKGNHSGNNEKHEHVKAQ